MKKILVIVSILVICAGSAFAIGAGIGARSIAMGGTGIATATDITSAYFNPAGLMYGAENFESQLMGGGATSGISEISEIGNSDTGNMLETFLPKGFNVNASLSGGLGFSVKKVGLSAIITGNTNFEKKADQLDMDINGSVNAAIPLTLGSTFSTPGLPIASMSVGVNLKSLYDIAMVTHLASTAGVATGYTGFSMGTGFGFDIGAMAKITPLITVGGVIRNLSASENITVKTKTLTATIDAADPTKLKLVEDPEVESKVNYTPPAEVGVGVAVMIPITGTLVACDLENYSYPDNLNINKAVSYTDTHIGIEQGVLFNMVMLRAGYFTYGVMEDSFYTWGIGFNAGPANLGLAAANSVKDSKGSIASFQAGLSF